jgi:hypothetical protein
MVVNPGVAMTWIVAMHGDLDNGLLHRLVDPSAHVAPPEVAYACPLLDLCARSDAAHEQADVCCHYHRGGARRAMVLIHNGIPSYAYVGIGTQQIPMAGGSDSVDQLSTKAVNAQQPWE